MKIFYFLIVFLFSCGNNKKTSEKTSEQTLQKTLQTQKDSSGLTINYWIDKLNGNKYYLPDSFANKPASFYLNNPKVSETSGF